MLHERKCQPVTFLKVSSKNTPQRQPNVDIYIPLKILSELKRIAERAEESVSCLHLMSLGWPASRSARKAEFFTQIKIQIFSRSLGPESLSQAWDSRKAADTQHFFRLSSSITQVTDEALFMCTQCVYLSISFIANQDADNF